LCFASASPNVMGVALMQPRQAVPNCARPCRTFTPTGPPGQTSKIQRREDRRTAILGIGKPKGKSPEERGFFFGPRHWSREKLFADL